MKFTFKSGIGSSITRPSIGPLPPVRPPGGAAHPSSITGPVASATGGGTVLGATIPIMYGETRIKGFLALAERYDEMLTLVWVLCSGECAIPLATECYLNNELVDSGGGSYLDYIVATSSAPGSVSQGGAIMPVMSWLNTESGTTDYSFLYPGQTIFAARINTLLADLTSFNLEWDGNGRRFADFRTPYTVAAHKNPVLIAWDILTSEWPWPGVLNDELDPSLNLDIDIDQWTEWADWCDGTTVYKYDYTTKVRDPIGVALGRPRWEFNGVVKNTNPWDAANAVLSNSFLTLVNVNGRVQIRAEADVTPSDVYIPEGRFLSHVEINDADPNTIPTEMEVAFIAAENYSECKIVYQRPSVPGEYVKLASTLYGCNLQSQALRWAEQSAKIYRERWSVKFLAGTEVANAAPGDIIEAYLPYGFGDTFIRVMSIIAQHDKGKYQIMGRLVLESVESVDLGSTYSPENPDGGWSTGTPNVPRNFLINVYSKKSSRDTYAPMINVSWDPPLSGPRVRFYELKQESTIIARVFGVKWSGPVMDTQSSARFYVSAVGFNGTESTLVMSRAVNLDVGFVSGIGGTPVGGGSGLDGGVLVFNDSVGEYQPVVHPHNFELHSLIVQAGLTVSNTGSINAAGDSEIVSAIATPTSLVPSTLNYFVNRALSTPPYTFQIEQGYALAYPVSYDVVVGITESFGAYDPDSGNGLTIEEEINTS